MIAGGIMSTSFQYLAISIATERENGMLKRLSGTPMPRTAYFAGKLVQVMVCTVAETVLLMAVGMLFYHLHLPTEPGRWWTFAWVFVLGSAACALLGIAASSVPRSAASAMPVITLPFTVLQFISGVYVPFSVVPGWMRAVASFFPLKWMAQGMRSVFLPEQAATLEPAGSWEHGRTALVLLAWTAAGLILCVKTFRWQSRS
jgi:ABC-2 type transport system permease protein